MYMQSPFLEEYVPSLLLLTLQTLLLIELNHFGTRDFVVKVTNTFPTLD
jgi:hypothetical protein